MYNQLPSTILRDGTTFDLIVTDVYATWEKHKTNPEDTDLYDPEQLQSLVDSVRK